MSRTLPPLDDDAFDALVAPTSVDLVGEHISNRTLQSSDDLDSFLKHKPCQMSAKKKSDAPSSWEVKPSDKHMPGKIYFGRHDAFGITIGFTAKDRADKRVREWSRRPNLDVEILAVVPGFKDDEERLHKLFAEYLQPGPGEECFEESLPLVRFVDGVRFAQRDLSEMHNLYDELYDCVNGTIEEEMNPQKKKGLESLVRRAKRFVR